MASSDRKVVLAALVGNLAVAITKFFAAYTTGSSAMLSEGVHSLVDTSNEVLMLYGMRRAARPADDAHPFGHGREIYFWAFIVALLVFALGAGVSIYEGIKHLQRPEPMERPLVNYLVLGASLVFEGFSWAIAAVSSNRTVKVVGSLLTRTARQMERSPLSWENWRYATDHAHPSKIIPSASTP